MGRTEAVGRMGEWSAAMGRTAVADATLWETDTGTTIGAAVMATVTATGSTDRTATHMEALAGDGHPKAVFGCAAAAAATARPTGTAIIEEDGVTTVGMAMGHTVVDAISAER